MIYFHIPFCKQACHYCDFHFSTSLKYKDEMLQAMHKELAMRADYLTDKKVESVYFGGGTPSILAADDISQLLESVQKYFDISADAEITLEANPDDLNAKKTADLRHTLINRFSIGIQSFFEEDLRWMNRAHHAQEAEAAIKRVQDAGFENITSDLIYGYPLLSDEKWQANIQKLLDLNVPHISAYAMTVENKTALDHLIKKGKTPAMDEAQSAHQMVMLMDKLAENGFEQYEISNFAKLGAYAKHNTNYWKGKHYLGIGPSAHSFNGNSRSWNIANNARYMAGMAENKRNHEIEMLSMTDQLNEYIMTALRTMWGMDMEYLEQHFGSEYTDRILKESHVYLQIEHLYLQNKRLILTSKGKVFADRIASNLFMIE